MQEIKIFTDGACRGNPGPGGWGVLVESDGDKKSFSGAQSYTTNNQMELLAVIKGLNSLSVSSDIVVVTDSQYVCRGVTEWLNNWKKNNWRTASGKAVKNINLWKELDAELQRHNNITWQWVKGHSGHIENEFVDKLANKAIDELL